MVEEDLILHDAAWFAERRGRAHLQKLRNMIDYAESLRNRLVDGDEHAWVRGRYEHLIRQIETSTDFIPITHSYLSSPVGEEREEEREE